MRNLRKVFKPGMSIGKPGVCWPRAGLRLLRNGQANETGGRFAVLYEKSNLQVIKE
jgi:hypothetical protein